MIKSKGKFKERLTPDDVNISAFNNSQTVKVGILEVRRVCFNISKYGSRDFIVLDARYFTSVETAISGRWTVYWAPPFIVRFILGCTKVVWFGLQVK